jgi:helix-turn-helix protein
MSMTLEELKLQLASKLDEVTLLEVLGITAEELVEAFEDRIAENYNKLVKDMDYEEWQLDD